MSHNIVDIKNMGDALRNTGYKNIESAVAEIVDNSIEANAKNVFIILKEKTNPVSGRKNVEEIAFLDNGDGMPIEILEKCLGIGSTTRQARNGMGRFGVGLPQASLYACPEIEVYSWQNGINNCYKTFLDINKVKNGQQTELSDPTKTSIPEDYNVYIQFNTLLESYDFEKSGTLVIWKNCDRLQPKTASPLIERLEWDLGQKYRYFIHKGKCKINILRHENQDRLIAVYPNDPLFLMEDNYVLGNPEEPGKAYIKEQKKALVPLFKPYGDDDGKVIVPVNYYDKNGNICNSTVTIRFSIVKDEFYDETAFKGKDPGSQEFGKKYAKRMEGISVIRADREIDFRKFDFYDNLDKPQHRWWGCEIIFTPELDEAFGVSNNKQYVELKEVDPQDFEGDDVKPMWEQLRSVVKNTINKMYEANKVKRKNTRSLTDIQNASTDIINDVENDSSEPVDSETLHIRESTPEETLIEDAKNYLEEQGIEEPTTEEVKAYLDNSVNFDYKSLGKFGAPFDYSFKLGTAQITINTEHPLYAALLNKIYHIDDVQTTFELFLGSFVKAVDETHQQEAENDKLIVTWHAKLRKYIEEQLNPRNPDSKKGD